MATALTPITTPSSTALALAGGHLTRDQIDLIKRTIAKGATDDELALFVATANRMGLDPFARQIFAVKRRTKDGDQWVDTMAIQVSIDGYRLNAARTGEYDGQEGPYWCGADGAWKDVWLDDKPPAAAKVIVYRKGVARGFVGVATYASYVQTNRDGKPNAMWSRGSDFMIAKCSEAVALRKAFPNELGGTVTPEEVGDDMHVEVMKPLGPIAGTPATGTPTTSSSTAQQSTAKPADPPKPTAPALTEGDMEDLITAIGKTASKETLKEIGNRIRAANATTAQRDELRSIYEAQLDELDAIESADREAAKS